MVNVHVSHVPESKLEACSQTKGTILWKRPTGKSEHMENKKQTTPDISWQIIKKNIPWIAVQALT